jgi:prevent-host-death family protein
MAIETGIRELKAKLSAYMRQVKSGETIVITEHGKPIGRIVPIGKSTQEQLATLVRAGFINWNSQKLSHISPPAHTKGDRPLSEILLEARE